LETLINIAISEERLDDVVVDLYHRLRKAKRVVPASVRDGLTAV